MPALVGLPMAQKGGLLHKIHGAQVALKRLLAGVDANVRGQVAFTVEGFAAVFTFEWALASVYSSMFRHVRAVTGSVAAHEALPQAFFS